MEAGTWHLGSGSGNTTLRIWEQGHSTYGRGLGSNGSAGAEPPTPPAHHESSAAGGSADAHPSWLLIFSSCPACWRAEKQVSPSLPCTQEQQWRVCTPLCSETHTACDCQSLACADDSRRKNNRVSSSPSHWFWRLWSHKHWFSALLTNYLQSGDLGH